MPATYVDTGLADWIDDQIAKRVFRNHSHAVERALFVLRESMEASR